MISSAQLAARLPLLQRLGPAREAGLLLTSLPWPDHPARPLALEGGATFQLPLGRWPESGAPRRLLLATPVSGLAPETIRVADAAPASPTRPPPSVGMERVAESPLPYHYWEQHCLSLRHGERRLQIIMGMRTGGEIHWWEACRLDIREATPECTVAEMGGAIGHQWFYDREGKPTGANPSAYAHRHNWLNGRLYVRLYANGVCEIYAHTINSRFFDEGRDLEDVVPVIGFRVEGGPTPVCPPPIWTGTPSRLTLGGVRLDLGDAARLATPRYPGAWETHDGFLVWQPYAGVELFGGLLQEERTGDPSIVRPEERRFPRGMARTLRFSASLQEGVSPTVVRYLAPAWWYGMCREFSAEALLPVTSEWDGLVGEAREWVREGIVEGGFEDGAVPRYLHRAWTQEDGRVRHEAGWDGEMPYAQFLDAWRTGDAAAYDRATRSAWHFTDVAVDHASRLVRMHGAAPPAISLPMNRAQGTVLAWL